MFLRNVILTGIFTLFASCFLPSEAIAKDASAFYIGIEGFQDTYEEPDLDLTVDSDYGSVTVGYRSVGTDVNHYFIGAEGRLSYGTNDYESPSGRLSGVPQYEADLRLLGGQAVGKTARFRPYIGLGLRLFEDKGKGEFTDLGAYAYDRRIYQLYLPIGASYEMRMKNFSITPKLEVDALLWGRVNSRLQNLNNGPNAFNDQNAFTGYGIRGEVMFGKDMGKWALQLGPFVRYWDIGDSEIVEAAPGFFGLEPQNTRLQVGVTTRVIF